MEVLKVEPPISAGIMLSYVCTSECRHCMYACSPRAERRWMSREILRSVLEVLAPYIVPASPRNRISLNEGLHFTGGEPFLNYPLLIEGVRQAEKLGYPSVFVETNCFWAVSYEVARARFEELKHAGLEGVLVSANPFTAEWIPLERVETAIAAAEDVWGRDGVVVYHPLYLHVLKRLGVRSTIKLERFLTGVLNVAPWLLKDIFSPSVLLPMGRLVYSLHHLYEKMPAKAFFGLSCASELTRPWHVHVDCYCNYIPGYCAGISLGDVRRLNEWIAGIDLNDRPVLAALSRDLRDLYEYALAHDYRQPPGGYVSRCHMCLDIRVYLALEVGGFKELKPLAFYELVDLARRRAGSP